MQSTELSLASGRGAVPSGDGLAPWPAACQDAAERSAGVFSDNSVVGHTRINQVVHESREGKISSCHSGHRCGGLVEFTHTRVIKGRHLSAGDHARVSGTLQ